MAQLVMYDGEVFFPYLNTHLQAHVFFEIDVPGTRMTDHLAVGRFNKQRTFPEGTRQLFEAQRCKEAFAITNHLLRVGIALLKYFGQIIPAISALRCEQRVDIVPLLRPHVAKQVRRNWAGFRHDLRTVFFYQLLASVSVE